MCSYAICPHVRNNNDIAIRKTTCGHVKVDFVKIRAIKFHNFNFIIFSILISCFVRFSLISTYMNSRFTLKNIVKATILSLIIEPRSKRDPDGTACTTVVDCEP